jgi:hypothetical protein
MHYMRQRRHGDPNVEFPPGRPPSPKPADPELDALKRDNAALSARVVTLIRELDEAKAQATAAQRASQPTGALDQLAALGKENDRLTRENAALKAASPPPGGTLNDVVLKVRDLERENAALKGRLAKAEPVPDERVAELERQLKAARTRIRNLTGEAARAWAVANAKATTITKAEHVKLTKVFHPDSEARATKTRETQLTEAFQIFTAIKFKIT